MKKNGFVFSSLVSLAVGTLISGWGLSGKRAEHYIAFAPTPIPTSHTYPGIDRQARPGNLFLTCFAPDSRRSNTFNLLPRITKQINTELVHVNDFYVGGRGSCPLLDGTFLKFCFFNSGLVQAGICPIG